MINALHLRWIIPLCVFAALVLLACVVVGGRDDR